MFANYILDNARWLMYISGMSNPRPLLILSDAIAGTSGLSRIARDLSVRIHENLGDMYRLGEAAK